MELYEWIAQEKMKNNRFRQDHFAKKLGIAPARFTYIKLYKMLPTGPQALAIEKYTGGLVNGWDLMLRCIKNMGLENK